MNLQLVESLAQIINRLTPEEQELLRDKTTFKKTVLSQREVNSFNADDISEVIYQMREERSEQLMEACFPELSQARQE
jgi:hypothetical protein